MLDCWSDPRGGAMGDSASFKDKLSSTLGFSVETCIKSECLETIRTRLFLERTLLRHLEIHRVVCHPQFCKTMFVFFS